MKGHTDLRQVPISRGSSRRSMGQAVAATDLVAMNDLNLVPVDKKVAKVAGDTSQHHPHGDSDHPTLVRPAQPFAANNGRWSGQLAPSRDPPTSYRRVQPMRRPACSTTSTRKLSTVRNYDDTVMNRRYFRPSSPICWSTADKAPACDQHLPHNLLQGQALLLVLDNLRRRWQTCKEMEVGLSHRWCDRGRRGIHEAYSKGRGLLTLLAHTLRRRDQTKKGDLSPRSGVSSRSWRQYRQV